MAWRIRVDGSSSQRIGDGVLLRRATVIVAVHVHGNDTVEVIATVDDWPLGRSTGRITIRVGFTFRCTATVTGPITSTSTQTDHDHDHVRSVEEL